MADEQVDSKMSDASPSNLFTPYQINKYGIKYDPVDTRELKELFGEDLYRYFKIDKKHGQYHLSLFIISETPEHYTWEGGIDLIEKVCQAHPEAGNPKQILNYLSGIRPRSRRCYAISCTYSFSESIENPSGALELYYTIDKYMANNKNICNYIGSDKDNSRCHFYTNKNQIYHHSYLIFNVPLNITGLGVFDKKNSIKTTDFIVKKIAPIRMVGQIKWERAKDHRTGLIKETIELQTFSAIKKQNKQVKEFEVKFFAAGYEVNRTIKIVKRRDNYQQLESFKVYDPEKMQTNFMKKRLQFESDKEEQKQQQQQKRVQIANARVIANQPSNISSAMDQALGEIMNHNHNHNNVNNNNNNNNNNIQQQQNSSVSPSDIDMGGGDDQ